MKRYSILQVFVVLAAILFLAVINPPHLRAAIPQSERDALIALYTATNGDNWTDNTNWRLPGDPSQFNTAGTENTWYGVTLTLDQQHVLWVQLPDNNLSGTVPPEITALGQLETLDLNYNHLTGSLPDLAGLNALKVLDVSLNSLWFPLTSINTLTALTTLNLSSNNYAGHIPDLSALTNLTVLDMGCNDLHGEIPTWMTVHPGLTAIKLRHNYLEGTIPDLTALTQLQVLDLDENLFTGSIPAWLNQMPGLRELRLHSNTFSGTIPDLGNLTQLTALDLGGNGLTGEIPAYISTLTNLEYLQLGYNDHTGVIPDLSALTGLTYLMLRSNQLTGTIPAGISGLTNLTTLDLGHNQLTGTIPDISNLVNLTDLCLEYNQLTGAFPQGIGNLTALRFLYLSSNQLDGGIPPGIGLTDLYAFYANDNLLDGELPPEIWNLSGLTYLGLSNNHLTGTLPPGIANANRLNYLYLNNNRISGSIPPEIGSLTQLERLYLDSNQLTGEIPYELRSTGVQYIGFSYNGLYTDDSYLESYIDSRHVGDFEDTQTIPPTLYPYAEGHTSIGVFISYRYRSDPGQFRIYYSETSGSGYQLAGTVDKSESVFTVTGLSPQTTYYFVADAFTDAHANNQNSITSALCEEKSAITAGPGTLTVTSPNGGEYWQAGSIYHLITWDSTGGILWVNIEYSTDNGNTWTLYTDASASSGAVEWWMPYVHSDQCLVRVSDTMSDASDVSNGVFTIYIPKSISVTTPNYSTYWTVGSTETIYYSTQGPVDNVKIEYSTNGGSSWSTVVESTPDTGTYDWLIPNTPSTTCIVRVSDAVDSTVNDTGGSFTIASSPALEVLTPNGTEALLVGSQYDITWAKPGDTAYYVDIEYSIDGGGSWNTIVTYTPNDGVHRWTVPNFLSTDCLVKITDSPGYGSFSDTSDSTFTITIPMIPAAERDALIALYNSTDGDNWTYNTNWRKPGDPTQFNDPGTEKNWYGVTCNTGNTYVRNINLGLNNLVGTIPDISALTELQSLQLNGNSLTGTIPTQLNNLTALTVLDLTGNDLQSPLPDLGALTGLNTLKLGANQFTGTVPTWVNTLTALTTLELQGNQLVGPVPDLSALTQLQVFNIGGNLITGNVPLFLAQLTTLTDLDLSSNQFDGTIPDLSTLTALQSLYLNSNQFTGDIPLWISTLTNLEYVYLNGNQLTGTLPDMSALTNLKSLHLSSNQLSGSIPAWIGSMTSLLEIYLDFNELSGGIPPEIGNLPSLKRLYVSNNRLSGAVPAELGNLTTLQYLGLESNGLIGSIPGSIANLTNLYIGGLDIRYNGLYTSDSGLKIFLYGKLDGYDWESTQTVAPVDIAVSKETMDSVTVNWTPIVFQSTPGEYRVYYSTTPGSGYTLAGSTADKTEDNFTVTGLDAETIYYFVVEAFTDAHSNNENPITSEYSAEVSGTTLEVPTLTVISPNTGESWEGNTNQTITWNSTGVVDDVKLEYSTNNGASWNTIIASTPNSGSYGWLVPNTPSTQCLVKISDVVGSASDASDAVFSIVPERTLTVTAPNGGESWEGDTLQTVTWNSTGSIANVKLEYSIDNGGSWNTVIASVSNSGSYGWTVPNTPSAQCLVRVSDAAGTASDVSNGVFTILQGRSVTVTAPDGGQRWFIGSVYPVTWTTTGSISTVNIEYSVDNGGSWDFIASAANSGSYNWTIPNTPSTACLVKVSEASGSAFDVSNGVFTIDPYPTITVTSPDGGQDWDAGTTQAVTWSYTGTVATVNIEYSADGGGSWNTAAASVSNTGSYNWTLPYIDSADCLVRVSDTQTAASDTSNSVFGIWQAPSVTVTSPDGGETWAVGSVQTITWDTTGQIGSVKIEYTRNDGKKWNTVIASTSNTGSYQWTVPSQNKTYYQCLVRITALDNSGSDVSNGFFTILN